MATPQRLLRYRKGKCSGCHAVGDRYCPCCGIFLADARRIPMIPEGASANSGERIVGADRARPYSTNRLPLLYWSFYAPASRPLAAEESNQR